MHALSERLLNPSVKEAFIPGPDFLEGSFSLLLERELLQILPSFLHGRKRFPYLKGRKARL